MADMINSVVESASEYNFFQLLRLLRTREASSKLCLRPRAGSGFPASDVLEGRHGAHDEIEILLGFMGLYGVNAPLALSTLDRLNGETDEAQVCRRLLDVIHQRLYELFYEAWKSCHLLFDRKKWLRIGRQCCGGEARFLPFMSYFNARVHQTMSLQEMLECLVNVPVRIKQDVLYWAKVSKIRGLGQVTCLGDNTFLGDRVLETQFSILIGPLTLRTFHVWLAEGGTLVNIQSLAQHYLSAMQPIVWRLVLTDPHAIWHLQGERLGCETALGPIKNAVCEWQCRSG